MKRSQILPLSIIFVDILAFAVIIQFFRDADSLAKWIFNFLNDWGMILSASATLLLAIGTFWVIRQNYLFREGDHRKRLLNEIIEWATDVLQCNRGPTNIARGFTETMFRHNVEQLAAVDVLSWRGVYIGFIADSLSNRVMQDAIKDARTLIRQHAKLLELELDHKVKNINAIGVHRAKIDLKAKEVIQLAVELL